VLRRLIKASALAVGVGLAAAGCAVTPVKMGAAAIVGDDRISIATLDTEVTNLSQTVKRYPGIIDLPADKQTHSALTWLVRFRIDEELARQAGITVSAAQAQQALAQVYDQAKAQAQASGVSNVTPGLVMAANGIPPDLAPEVGRYVAIETEFARRANGGKAPTSSTAQAAAGAKLLHAQCEAAKTLKIAINPQFGRMDYAQNPYQIVPVSATVARSAGPAPSASPTGLAPAC
jgi:hypothetical protein